MKSIESRVDALCSIQRPVPQKKKHGRFTAWITSGGSLIVALKLCAVLGVAVLVGTMGTFVLIQQQDIALEGVGAPAIFFDGVQMVDPTYNIPVDVFSDNKLIAGETETFTHTVMSPSSDGDWELYWDVHASMPWWNDTGAEFYGYYFSTINETDQEISSVVVLHGETKEINFVHSLDPHFQETSNAVPFQLELNIVPFVLGPLAVDDVYSFTSGGAKDLMVLTNDIDNAGLGLMIVSCSLGTISGDGQYITYSVVPDHHVFIEYTIEDSGPLHKQSTAVASVSCV